MKVLVTGVAGFIGYHVAAALLSRGDQVVGVDNLNDYYDPQLKAARLGRLEGRNGFAFVRADIGDPEALNAALAPFGRLPRVVHLAAQAGVRYSLQNPFTYLRSNLAGHLSVLEFCRRQPEFEHLVYASSSSVYGGNVKIPFAADDRTDHPVSLYGATKKADELMSQAYAHLYGFPQTGLRYFTVYGPWGRPDMALYVFTRAILGGEPIRVFNHGDMRRDFTFIDDIVAGTLGALDRVAPGADPAGIEHGIYNLGNHRSEPLMHLIEVLEAVLGRQAIKELEPMQPGDVKETYADIEAARRDFGFEPTTSIEAGVPRFVAWYRDYHGS